MIPGHRTPQFWLVWLVLLLNVSASIGIIGVASPMLQEIFGGRLISTDVAFTAFNTEQKAAAAAVGAGFVGLVSLFNIGGRPLWSSASDRLGRKVTFAIMTTIGALLYGYVAPGLYAHLDGSQLGYTKPSYFFGFGFDLEGFDSDVHFGLVPEPSSWMTMILGFGMLGLVMRRRSGVLSGAEAAAA